jgi:hypothetical protein
MTSLNLLVLIRYNQTVICFAFPSDAVYNTPNPLYILSPAAFSSPLVASPSVSNSHSTLSTCHLSSTTTDYPAAN